MPRGDPPREGPALTGPALLGALGLLVLAAPGRSDTHRVRPDGTGDFPTIQAALAAAVDGDEILLEDGTFTGPGNRDLDFLGKAVTVRSASGLRDRCVIDCEREGGGFVFASGEGPASSLADVTLTRSAKGFPALDARSTSPTFRNVVVREGQVPSVAVESGAPLFTGCLFEANSSASSGAGGTCYYGICFDEADVRLEGCTVRTFLSGFGLVARGGTTLLRDCDLSDGRGFAVVATSGATSGSIQLERCTFRDNEHGVMARDAATARLRDCTLSDQRSIAARVESGGRLVMERCLVERNGLGVDLRAASSEGTAEIRDCVIRENETHGIRGAGEPLVERCRIQGNRLSGVFLERARSAVVRDCLITGNGSHGVKVWRSFPVSVERCTVTSNRAAFSGGGLSVPDGTVSVSRSILRGNCSNDGWEVWLTGGSRVELSCVNVEASRLRVFGEGTLAVTDLLEEDPTFCDPLECAAGPAAGGSWVLTPGSPALLAPCGAMGAPGPLCAVPVGVRSGVEAVSWGRIKARYR